MICGSKHNQPLYRSCLQRTCPPALGRLRLRSHRDTLRVRDLRGGTEELLRRDVGERGAA